jgi:hypothetical protein
MPALGVLTKLVYSLDDEVLIDACWAVSYLSDGTNDKIQAVIESGVCRRLVDLLMYVTCLAHEFIADHQAPINRGPDPCSPFGRKHRHWR